MKKLPILPAVTLPWREKFFRRHTPDPVQGVDGYREYRACLRWEFGFSCAFCLCHEADLMLAGTEGWGLMQIEHFSPKSSDPDGRNDYSNCFYVCGRCNRSHGKTPTRDRLGYRLLNPCESVWGDVFVVEGSQLLPRDPKDSDAAYTQSTYRLNDQYKVRLRALRKEVIKDRVGFLERSNRYLDAIFSRIAAGGTSAEIEMAREISHRRVAAARDLLRYRAVPRGRNQSCRCGSTTHHNLPQNLEEQAFDLVDLLPRGRSRTTEAAPP